MSILIAEYHRLYMGLLGIVRQLMEDREWKFGIYSMEYVMATTYYYDLVALRKALNLNKCVLEKDLAQVKSSLQILAPEARAIFERYIEMYIGDDDK